MITPANTVAFSLLGLLALVVLLVRAVRRAVQPQLPERTDDD